MAFSRQEYWNRSSFLSPGYLPNPGIELAFSALQADSLPSRSPGKLSTTKERVWGMKGGLVKLVLEFPVNFVEMPKTKFI